MWFKSDGTPHSRFSHFGTKQATIYVFRTLIIFHSVRFAYMLLSFPIGHIMLHVFLMSLHFVKLTDNKDAIHQKSSVGSGFFFVHTSSTPRPSYFCSTFHNKTSTRTFAIRNSFQLKETPSCNSI